jgi:hypothetical protein
MQKSVDRPSCNSIEVNAIFSAPSSRHADGIPEPRGGNFAPAAGVLENKYTLILSNSQLIEALIQYYVSDTWTMSDALKVNPGPRAQVCGNSPETMRGEQHEPTKGGHEI